MPTSTSTGRAVKELIDDPDFRRKKGTNPKTNFCKIVDKHLDTSGNDLMYALRNKHWQDVYTSFTKMRRLIEIKEEACK